METHNEETTYTTRQLYVNEIHFADNEEVFLLGFSEKEGNFIEAKYVSSPAQLDDLLAQSGKNGREIMNRIETSFAHPHTSPFVIDLVDMFGLTQILESEQIVLEPASALDESTPVHNMPETLFVQEIICPAGPAIY
jgi:hypothetical protein